MSVNRRAQDILLGAIFGLVLGVCGNLWASVYDHLFIEKATQEALYIVFIVDSIGIIAIGIGVWIYARRLERK